MQMQQQEHALKFTGDGWEYFGIWIVNLLLTILTLGIYSAWAKVRKLQYFYRNTRLADASFDYHGSPLAILKGRIIAVVLLVLYSTAGAMNDWTGFAFFLLLAGLMPWLMVRSLRFKLHNSSYRGLRFAFGGSDREAYRVFLLFPFFTVFTLYLLAPFTHQRIKQYQHRNSRFGATSFDFNASAGAFYGVYLTAIAIVIGLVIAAGLTFAAASVFAPLAALVPLLFLFAGLLIAAYLAVSLSNLIWNSTTLGEHAFSSRMKVGSYLWLGFTNLLGILFTLGLFTPFATVRMMRYKLENMSVLAQGSLADFVAGQEQQAGATGQETADIFGFDISL